jgi:tetratricopeptide (TPR) repeat protein
MSTEDESDRDRIFCEELVRRGWATEEQVAEVRRLRQAAEELGQPTTIDSIFVRKGYTPQERVTVARRDVAAKLGQSLRIGKYEILQRLGEGGSGIVYRAYQTTLGREVALKVLTQRREGEEEYLDRFLREAKVAVTLNHVNIVRGLDFGHADGYHYFAMELVDGESLNGLIRAEGRLSEAKAIDFALQMVRALEHAAKYQIVHRDIKPENILVTKSGTAKLCDLGLARPVIAQGTAAATGGRPMGTALYVAPEQIRHEPNLDFRADIYSLGATLYHALTGAPPFTGATVQEIVRAHLSGPVPNPRDRVLEISTGTASVVMKMLAKDPADRYLTLEALDEDLSSVLDGRPPVNTITIGRRAAGLAEGGVARAPERRPPSRAAGPVIAIVSVAILGVGAWAMLGRKGDATTTTTDPGTTPVVVKDPGLDAARIREAKETEGARALAAAKDFAKEHGADTTETEEKYREVALAHADTSSGRVALQSAEEMAKSRRTRIEGVLGQRTAAFEKAFGEGRLGAALAAWDGLPKEVEAGGGAAAATAARTRVEDAARKALAGATALAAKAAAGDEAALEEARKAFDAVAGCGIETAAAEAAKGREALDAGARDRAARLRAAEEAWPRVCAEALGAFPKGLKDALAAVDTGAEVLAPLGPRAAGLKELLGDGAAFVQAIRNGFSKSAAAGESVRLRVPGRPGGAVAGRATALRPDGFELQRGPAVEFVAMADVDTEDLGLLAWKTLGAGSAADHRGAAVFLLSRGAFAAAEDEAKALEVVGAKDDAVRVRVVAGTLRGVARARAEASLREAEVLRLQKRLPEARVAFEKAAALSPDDALPLWKLGAFLLETGKDAGDAAKPLEAAAARSPAEPEAWYWIGEARRRGGRADEAAAAFDRFLAAAPADHPLREPAGKALGEVRGAVAAVAAKQAREDAARAYRKDDFRGAEALWRKVLAASPDDTEAMYFLGKSLLAIDRRVEGYSSLRRFLNAERRSGARVEDARKVVKDLESRLGDSPAALRKAHEAAGATDSGRWPVALDLLNEAVDLAPLRSDTYVERARALLYGWKAEGRKDHLNQAAQDLDTAILINERNGRAWSMSAVTRFNLGEYEKAADASLRGVQLDPAWAPVWEYRARACNRIGRFAEAEQAATDGFAREPRAVLLLARAEARCGLLKLAAARQDLEAAVEKYELQPEEKLYRAEILGKILKAEKGRE